MVPVPVLMVRALAPVLSLFSVLAKVRLLLLVLKLVAPPNLTKPL